MNLHCMSLKVISNLKIWQVWQTMTIRVARSYSGSYKMFWWLTAVHAKLVDTTGHGGSDGSSNV